MAGKMIGVEIGNDTVKLVVTNGNAVQSMAVKHMPENMVLDGKVASPDAMANFIKEMRKEFRIPGGSAALAMHWGSPPVVNDGDMAAFAARCAAEVLGADQVITQVPHPNMGGEDFAFYLEQVPGAFMFLSSADAALHTDIPHHNARFNVDESVLWEGAAVFAAIAQRFLNG